jgi:opacity protein-like surface antigen
MVTFMKQSLIGAALLAAGVVPALAADPYEPPVYQPEPIYQPEPELDYGGWYIRGDLDYHATKFRGAHYITYGPPPGTGEFDFGNLESSWSVGGGVGYQANKYFRTDLTLDWMGKSGFRGQTSGTCGGVPCVSVDTSSYSALLLLANAYAEFGTWHGITPYVGAGIGGAYVKWDDLRNTAGGITTVHDGAANWRFAWALMAGASYCLTDDLKFDLGYRYSNIQGGKMFQFASGVGPGYDDGFHIHEGRAGLRYQFGGSSGCSEPEPIAYTPEPIDPPVYK